MQSEIEWLEEVKEMLAEALPGYKEREREALAVSGCEIHAEWRGTPLRVEIKSIRAPRIAEVEGQLARYVLKTGRHEDASRSVPILVIAFSSYGRKLEQAVRDFMKSYAPETGWGLIDQCDQATLVVPRLDVDWSRAPSHLQQRPSLFERRSRSLFSDLNRWLLKVLILENAPPTLWGGPRQSPRHPTELAQIANVSTSKAHHFTSTFHQAGYLRISREGLRLLRLPELLQAWLQDEKNSPARILSVRSLLPPQASSLAGRQPREEPDLPREAWPHAALGGAFAAMHSGLLRVGGPQLPLVHVSWTVRRALKDWRLEVCDKRDAQMFLVKPLYPKSVFRGVVDRVSGAPLVDIWQIAIDAVSVAARGDEQAEYIVERVLALQVKK